jgi:Ca2+-binding RTX toxin-like protein
VNDLLNGMQGSDVLFGETGADTFRFEAGTGADLIDDFQAGADKINLVGYGLTFAQWQTHFIQSGSTGAIDRGSGDLVVLHNVTMANLTATDFIFG